MKTRILKTIMKTFHKTLQHCCENIQSIIAMTTSFKFLSNPPWQLFPPLGKKHQHFPSFCSASNSHRRHILSFNLALFILFRFGFSFRLDAMGSERARVRGGWESCALYPTPKLLRLLCFMGNAITFIPLVVKIYLFSAFKLRTEETFTAWMKFITFYYLQWKNFAITSRSTRSMKLHKVFFSSFKGFAFVFN